MKVQSDYNYFDYTKPAFKAKLSSGAVTEEMINIITTHYDYGKQYMEALKINLERIPSKDIFSISKFEPSSLVHRESGYMIKNETNGATVKFFDEQIANCKTKFYNSSKLHTQNLAEAIYDTIMKELDVLLGDASVLEGVEFIKPDLSGFETKDIQQLSAVVSNPKMPRDLKKRAIKLLNANKNSDSLSLGTKNQIETILRMYGGKKS